MKAGRPPQTSRFPAYVLKQPAHRPCRSLNCCKDRTLNRYCCLWLPRCFVTSDRSKRYGGSVWESNRNTKSQTLCLRGVAPPRLSQSVQIVQIRARKADRGPAARDRMARLVSRQIHPPAATVPALWSEGSESLCDHCHVPAWRTVSGGESRTEEYRW